MIFKKKFFNLSLISIFFFLFIQKSFSLEPSEFIQITVNKASAALSSNFTKEEKIIKLREIAKESVDIKGIGFYTLGSYRKTISDGEKEQYLTLFEQYFLKSFSDRLTEYTDPKVHVQSSKKINEKYTIVSSILIATEKRPEVKIDWRVYTKNPENPLIRDLIIEGLSLARTQKEEFSSIIQSNDGDIKALFSSLEKFIDE
jgi:phospholipid transport system substrate-binding protein